MNILQQNNYEEKLICNAQDIQDLAMRADKIKVGDLVELPTFTVPETTIDGEKKLHFDERKISDNAIVYKIDEKYIYLVFEHALFESAMDLNEATEWKNTQLRQYLKGAFKTAMKESGINAKKVSLLSYDEMFGEKQLPFFKKAKNRCASVLTEEYTNWLWLKTSYKDKEDVASSSDFCYCNDDGYAGYSHASNASFFVRPRFAIAYR